MIVLYVIPEPNTCSGIGRTDAGKINPVSVLTNDLTTVKYCWNTNPGLDCAPDANYAAVNVVCVTRINKIATAPDMLTYSMLMEALNS